MTAYYLSPLDAAGVRGAGRWPVTGTVGGCICHGATRRELGVNECARRYGQGHGGRSITYPPANRARKLHRAAPSGSPYTIGPGIGERDAIGRADHNDRI